MAIDVVLYPVASSDNDVVIRETTNDDVARSPVFSNTVKTSSLVSLFSALGTAAVLLTAAPPFSQRDWSNPQRRYQVQDYIDPSEFWMLDSAIPRSQRDWSNPQIRRPQLFQDYIASTKFSMLAPVLPFVQDDWPNPQQPRRSGDLGYVISAKPTADYVLRLPITSRVLAVDQRAALLSTALGSSLTLTSIILSRPFIQVDWPNPRPRQQLLVDHIDPSEFWFLKDQFFGPPGMGPTYDWPNPQRVKPRSEYGSTDSYKVNLFAAPPSPFYLTDWQNPRSPRSLIGDQLGFTDPSEFWMLNGIIPFAQGDWKNPQLQRQRSECSGFVDPYKVLLFAAPQSPFNATNWPNPQSQRSRSEFGFSVPSEFWMLNSIIPFAQRDWKNPQPERQRSEYAGFTDQYKVLLFAAPPSPFYLTDWQNPRGPKATVGDQLGYLDPTEFWLLNGLKPINQNDWQNPQPSRKQSEYSGFIDPYKVLLFAVPPSPFYLTDWQNPQRPRGLIADQLGFIDPTEFWLLNSLRPFNQVDWLNPLRGKLPIFSYDLKLNLQLQIVPIPFNQFLWPNPTQPSRPTTDQIYFNKFDLYYTPFVQRNWPNPTRAKTASIGYVGYFDTYKVNLKSTPQRQTDWPNPSLGAPRTFANFGFLVREQIIPGLFPNPGNAQLLLTAYTPIRTLARLHHWRATSTLLGNVIQESDLSGSIDNEADLQGSVVNNKTDLEGGGTS